MLCMGRSHVSGLIGTPMLLSTRDNDIIHLHCSCCNFLLSLPVPSSVYRFLDTINHWILPGHIYEWNQMLSVLIMPGVDADFSRLSPGDLRHPTLLKCS